MHAYMCVRVYVSEHDSVKMVHSIEFKFSMYVIGHRRTNRIDFGEYRMNTYFYRSTKMNFYTLRPIKKIFLKSTGIQTVHSIELKFAI